MTRTYTPNKFDIKPDWHLIDAEGKVLGRLSSEAAKILIGKNKSIFTKNINVGDKVVIINADKIALTGNKMGKKYYRHTGFPGGIKEETLGDMLNNKPEDLIRNSIKGMLPKNKLNKERMTNLYIYRGTEHPHKGQIN